MGSACREPISSRASPSLRDLLTPARTVTVHLHPVSTTKLGDLSRHAAGSVLLVKVTPKLVIWRTASHPSMRRLSQPAKWSPQRHKPNRVPTFRPGSPRV